jgi:hypothetical protein
MMKYAVYIAIIAGAYWYWTGPYQDGRQISAADELENNAAIMKRCIQQERSMQGAGGLGGVPGAGSTGEDAEAVCAQKNMLHQRDGVWHSGSAEDY